MEFCGSIEMCNEWRRATFITTEVIERVKLAIIARGREVVGCSDAEIEALMVAQRVDHLPDLYVQLLKAAGQSLGGVFLGENVSISRLYACKDEFLEEELSIPGLEVPKDIFVFKNHQGYIWWFFRTNDCENDSAVYGWGEFDPGFRKFGDSFAEYLSAALNNSIKPKPSVQYFIYDPDRDKFVPLGIAHY